MADDSELYAGEDEKATLSKRRGQLAASQSGKERKETVSKQGEVERQDKGRLSRIAQKRLSDETAIAGFKKGGKVKKRGIYRLHRGERVLNAKQAKKFRGGKG